MQHPLRGDEGAFGDVGGGSDAHNLPDVGPVGIYLDVVHPRSAGDDLPDHQLVGKRDVAYDDRVSDPGAVEPGDHRAHVEPVDLGAVYDRVAVLEPHGVYSSGDKEQFAVRAEPLQVHTENQRGQPGAACPDDVLDPIGRLKNRVAPRVDQFDRVVAVSDDRTVELAEDPVIDDDPRALDFHSPDGVPGHDRRSGDGDAAVVGKTVADGDLVDAIPRPDDPDNPMPFIPRGVVVGVDLEQAQPPAVLLQERSAHPLAVVAVVARDANVSHRPVHLHPVDGPPRLQTVVSPAEPSVLRFLQVLGDRVAVGVHDGNGFGGIVPGKPGARRPRVGSDAARDDEAFYHELLDRGGIGCPPPGVGAPSALVQVRRDEVAVYLHVERAAGQVRMGVAVVQVIEVQLPGPAEDQPRVRVEVRVEHARGLVGDVHLTDVDHPVHIEPRRSVNPQVGDHPSDTTHKVIHRNVRISVPRCVGDRIPEEIRHGIPQQIKHRGLQGSDGQLSAPVVGEHARAPVEDGDRRRGSDVETEVNVDRPEDHDEPDVPAHTVVQSRDTNQL